MLFEDRKQRWRARWREARRPSGQPLSPLLREGVVPQGAVIGAVPGPEAMDRGAVRTRASVSSRDHPAASSLCLSAAVAFSVKVSARLDPETLLLLGHLERRSHMDAEMNV